MLLSVFLFIIVPPQVNLGWSQPFSWTHSLTLWPLGQFITNKTTDITHIFRQSHPHMPGISLHVEDRSEVIVIIIPASSSKLSNWPNDKASKHLQCNFKVWSNNNREILSLPIVTYFCVTSRVCWDFRLGRRHFVFLTFPQKRHFCHRGNFPLQD